MAHRRRWEGKTNELTKRRDVINGTQTVGGGKERDQSQDMRRTNTASVAVVGGRPYSDEVFIGKHVLVTLHTSQAMRPMQYKRKAHTSCTS